MKRLVVLAFLLYVPAIYAQQGGDAPAVQSADETIVFTPIYGSDSEMNALLQYITEWVILTIPQNESIHSVDCVIQCHITMDTTGRVTNIRIGKNRHPWLAYAISASLRQMPAYDSPLTRGRNFSHNLYFTFGPDGLPYNSGNRQQWDDILNRGLQDQIAAQKEEANAKTQAHYKKFDKFRNDNIVETMTQEMKKSLAPADGRLETLVPQTPLTPPPPVRAKTRVSVSVE